MRAVAVIRPGRIKAAAPDKKAVLDVVNIPEADVGEHDVKIKVAYCAICGSDPHVIENIFHRTPPYGIGHEVAGIVTELGPKAVVKGLKVGDRVAGNFLRACGTCYYCQDGHPEFCTNAVEEGECPGMAEYVVWDESQVWKVPDEIPLRKACLLEPLSIAVRIADQTNLKVGQRAVIQGGGPIGLLCTQVLKRKGVVDLTVIEPLEHRRVLAAKFGAKHVIDPTSCDTVKTCLSLTNGYGYDVVIEATGVSGIAGIPLEIAAPGGRVLYVGMYDNNYTLPIPMTDTFHSRNLTLTSTRVAPFCFPRAVQLLPDIELDDFTSVVFSLDQINEAFLAHASGSYPKVLVCCNEDLAEQ